MYLLNKIKKLIAVEKTYTIDCCLCANSLDSNLISSLNNTNNIKAQFESKKTRRFSSEHLGEFKCFNCSTNPNYKNPGNKTPLVINTNKLGLQIVNFKEKPKILINQTSENKKNQTKFNSKSKRNTNTQSGNHNANCSNLNNNHTKLKCKSRLELNHPILKQQSDSKERINIFFKKLNSQTGTEIINSRNVKSKLKLNAHPKFNNYLHPPSKEVIKTNKSLIDTFKSLKPTNLSKYLLSNNLSKNFTMNLDGTYNFNTESNNNVISTELTKTEQIINGVYSTRNNNKNGHVIPSYGKIIKTFTKPSTPNNFFTHNNNIKRSQFKPAINRSQVRSKTKSNDTDNKHIVSTNKFRKRVANKLEETNSKSHNKKCGNNLVKKIQQFNIISYKNICKMKLTDNNIINKIKRIDKKTIDKLIMSKNK